MISSYIGTNKAMLTDQNGINLWIDSIMDECQLKSDQSRIWEQTVCEHNRYLYSTNDYNIRNSSLIKRDFTVDRLALPKELGQSSWDEVCDSLRPQPVEKMVSSGPYSDRRIRMSLHESRLQTKRTYIGISDHYETTSMTIVIELLSSPDYSCVIC